MGLLTLLVPGMTCRHCVRNVTAALRDVPGVMAVLADVSTTTVVLHGSPDIDQVLAALEAAGFPGTVLPAPNAALDGTMPAAAEPAQGGDARGG